jgi:hypothetical protein
MKTRAGGSTRCTLVAVACAFAAALGCHRQARSDAPVVVLFDGTNLDAFDTFVRGKGLNDDPDRVFRVENGALHVSGTEHGYVITKQSFARYRLTAEFRWGEGTFGERAGRARDSGVLYHVQGPDKVWPRSIELQIQEGATGDFWMTDGASITGRDGKRVTGPPGRALNIDRFGKGPWKDVVGFRDPAREVERAHGEWNVVEVVALGDTIKHYVNGSLVNEGTNPDPTEGKILFQSEGAEIFFRNIRLVPIR